jgi:hypothetical protein
LSDILDGISHVAKGLELILSQPTPLPLASRCIAGGRLVHAIDDDDIGLFALSVASSGGGEDVPRGSFEPMENLSVAIPPTKIVWISL